MAKHFVVATIHHPGRWQVDPVYLNLMFGAVPHPPSAIWMDRLENAGMQRARLRFEVGFFGPPSATAQRSMVNGS